MLDTYTLHTHTYMYVCMYMRALYYVLRQIVTVTCRKGEKLSVVDSSE